MRKSACWVSPVNRNLSGELHFGGQRRRRGVCSLALHWEGTGVVWPRPSSGFWVGLGDWCVTSSACGLCFGLSLMGGYLLSAPSFLRAYPLHPLPPATCARKIRVDAAGLPIQVQGRGGRWLPAPSWNFSSRSSSRRPEREEELPVRGGKASEEAILSVESERL